MVCLNVPAFVKNDNILVIFDNYCFLLNGRSNANNKKNNMITKKTKTFFGIAYKVSIN